MVRLYRRESIQRFGSRPQLAGPGSAHSSHWPIVTGLRQAFPPTSHVPEKENLDLSEIGFRIDQGVGDGLRGAS